MVDCCDISRAGLAQNIGGHRIAVEVIARPNKLEPLYSTLTAYFLSNRPKYVLRSVRRTTVACMLADFARAIVKV